ncbi:helix-turn-helix domain-containing protein [Streptosporangium subroseum]|uniref:helix-turn-helix domain-containing protein n=1 Tax=Streptosporangium subroseum TaxID=106412 RepID=UPI00308585B1|nr:helix-turn-helix domain-containing protein [Streptosporangium subroseum]
MDGYNLLGEFLRARRQVTAPEQAGLPRSGRCRTPGLRREEVARLAGVSTDYYIRLEQGRERHPSDRVLDALVRTLDLGPEAEELVRSSTISGRYETTPGPGSRTGPGPARAGLRRVRCDGE